MQSLPWFSSHQQFLEIADKKAQIRGKSALAPVSIDRHVWIFKDAIWEMHQHAADAREISSRLNKQLGSLVSCGHLLEETTPVSRVVSCLFFYQFSLVFCWLWRSLETRQTCRGSLLVKCLVMCDPLLLLTHVMCKPQQLQDTPLQDRESCNVISTETWRLWQCCVGTMRVRWQDWYQSHICMLSAELEDRVSLA